MLLSPESCWARRRGTRVPPLLMARLLAPPAGLVSLERVCARSLGWRILWKRSAIMPSHVWTRPRQFIVPRNGCQFGSRYTAPRKTPPRYIPPRNVPLRKNQMFFWFLATLFRFVTCFARVRVEDSNGNRFASTAYFAKPGFVGGEYSGQCQFACV